MCVKLHIAYGFVQQVTELLLYLTLTEYYHDSTKYSGNLLWIYEYKLTV